MVNLCKIFLFSNSFKIILRYRTIGMCWLAANLFFLFNLNLYPQSQAPYLIPRQIYVGDPASLILPLPAARENGNIIHTKSGPQGAGFQFPADDNIDFHRIILEKSVTGSRLVIEFTAFAPGVLEFPEIEIGGEYFSGLSVTVNSLIKERTDRVLSGNASTLAMPGTALLIYGSMAVLAAVIIFAVWFFVKGRSVLKKLIEKWKRYRLFNGIRQTEKHLQKLILQGTDIRLILDELSRESRDFLSVLTGKNCRAMTAGEFDKLPAEIFTPAAPIVSDTLKSTVQEDEYFKIEIIGDFFRNCDDLRFSGAGGSSQDIIKLLDDLLRMADMLERKK